MTEQNLTIEDRDFAGLRLDLSSYGLHAILRRLKGEPASDQAEADWVEIAIRRIERRAGE